MQSAASTDLALTIEATGGYTLARDGGVFAFGDAAYEGSTGGISLVQPVVGMAASP